MTLSSMESTQTVNPAIMKLQVQFELCFESRFPRTNFNRVEALTFASHAIGRLLLLENCHCDISLFSTQMLECLSQSWEMRWRISQRTAVAGPFIPSDTQVKAT